MTTQITNNQNISDISNEIFPEFSKESLFTEGQSIYTPRIDLSDGISNPQIKQSVNQFLYELQITKDGVNQGINMKQEELLSSYREYIEDLLPLKEGVKKEAILEKEEENKMPVEDKLDTTGQIFTYIKNLKETEKISTSLETSPDILRKCLIWYVEESRRLTKIRGKLNERQEILLRKKQDVIDRRSAIEEEILNNYNKIERLKKIRGK